MEGGDGCSGISYIIVRTAFTGDGTGHSAWYKTGIDGEGGFSVRVPVIGFRKRRTYVGIDLTTSIEMLVLIHVQLLLLLT